MCVRRFHGRHHVLRVSRGSERLTIVQLQYVTGALQLALLRAWPAERWRLGVYYTPSCHLKRQLLCARVGFVHAHRLSVHARRLLAAVHAGASTTPALHSLHHPEAFSRRTLLTCMLANPATLYTLHTGLSDL
jgi:hypothetical protein